MNESSRYESVKFYSPKEIEQAIMDNKEDELLLIPLSVGEYSTDTQYAQDVCVTLLQNKNSYIRANAVLGLSYIARNHQTLNENVIPILIAEYQTNSVCHERIRYAIEDICLFLGWKIIS